MIYNHLGKSGLKVSELCLGTMLFGKETNAKCTKCYDADTVHLVFSYNGQLCRWTCRLEGIDSAEIKSKNIPIVVKLHNFRFNCTKSFFSKKTPFFAKFNRILCSYQN